MRQDNPLGAFLRARRELVHPSERGLPDLGRRRVPGLRREEVAMLAGISAEYYVRLERGRDRHPSVQVIEALARVLDLDAESTSYLAALATPALRRTGVASDRGSEQVPAAIVRLLDSMPGVPAFVLGRFMDVLAYNGAAAVWHGGRPLVRLRGRWVTVDHAVSRVVSGHTMSCPRTAIVARRTGR
jgi:transcriptional regulator with XRE-family HTH domain